MDYDAHYNQLGSGLPVFQGNRYQKGSGLGGMFKRFFRWLLPVLKTHALPMLQSGAKLVGTEAVHGLANMALDTLNGKDIESVAKERGTELFNNIKAKDKAAFQNGSGYKRKRNNHNNNSYKKERRAKDIFD